MRAACSAALVALCPLVGRAMENEPKGLGEARFATSVEQVRAIHPDMQELVGGEAVAAPAVAAPKVRRFVLRGQKLAGTNVPVTIELRFWEDQFWLYITSFEATDRARVLAGLKSRYGPPDRGSDEQPIWAGAETIILGELQRGWFTTQSEVVGRRTRTWLTEALEAARRPKRLPRGHAPGPTPAMPGARPPSAPESE